MDSDVSGLADLSDLTKRSDQFLNHATLQYTRLTFIRSMLHNRYDPYQLLNEVKL